MNFGITMLDRAISLRGMETFATEVIPAVRAAEVPES